MLRDVARGLAPPANAIPLDLYMEIAMKRGSAFAK